MGYLLALTEMSAFVLAGTNPVGGPEVVLMDRQNKHHSLFYIR